MDKHEPDGLVVVEVKWEEKPGNGWLLAEIYDLILREPRDLTDRGESVMMPEEEGGEI